MSGIRPGEVATALPPSADAQLYFIGTIRTPWTTRADCPKRGDAANGPACRIVLNEPWPNALRDIDRHPRLQILYWMHEARRDLLLQTPGSRPVPTGTFALRSPVRPNPIASSVVTLIGVAGAELTVRGLDCLDGTPLLDIKPARDD
jgi:tRNA (adenine37-N6)-methyltransferase